MSKHKIFALTMAALLYSISALSAAGQTSSSLTLKGSVNLPGYTGDFDHFAVDETSGRLLLAAEDHGTVEVFDLDSGKHLRTISGFETPHSILVRPNASTILVTDSGKGMSKTPRCLDLRSKGYRHACAGSRLHWL